MLRMPSAARSARCARGSTAAARCSRRSCRRRCRVAPTGLEGQGAAHDLPGLSIRCLKSPVGARRRPSSGQCSPMWTPVQLACPDWSASVPCPPVCAPSRRRTPRWRPDTVWKRGCWRRSPQSAPLRGVKQGPPLAMAAGGCRAAALQRLAVWWLSGRAAQPPSQPNALSVASSSAPSPGTPVSADASTRAVAPPAPVPARAATAAHHPAGSAGSARAGAGDRLHGDPGRGWPAGLRERRDRSRRHPGLVASGLRRRDSARRVVGGGPGGLPRRPGWSASRDQACHEHGRGTAASSVTAVHSHESNKRRLERIM